MSIRHKYTLLFLLFFLSWYKIEAQEEKYIGLFVYNFIKYFDWPENMKSDDFIIDVLGHKSVYEELKNLTTEKKLGNQNIIVRNYTSVDKVRKCHMLFIGHWQSRYLADVLNKVGNYPSLIITEMEGLLDKGSAINFVIREGTIKFEININNINKHRIKIDARIYDLAYKVIE